MSENEYYPYLCREDAMEEYKSLRSEIIESQKQRVTLFQISIAFIGVLFGFLVRDGIITPSEALLLIVLTIAPSLFSYSTRCRERRIATFIRERIDPLSHWSAFSIDPKNKLGFLKRASVNIVFTMIIFDLAFLWLSRPPCILNESNWIIAVVFTFINLLILYFIYHLPNPMKKEERDKQK
jgi:hypothetical protein